MEIHKGKKLKTLYELEFNGMNELYLSFTFLFLVGKKKKNKTKQKVLKMTCLNSFLKWKIQLNPCSLWPKTKTKRCSIEFLRHHYLCFPNIYIYIYAWQKKKKEKRRHRRLIFL